MNIILLGYMGSGKSSVGSKVAEYLNYEFIDLDDYISTTEKKSISDIFKEKGEIYFRKQESLYLKQLLTSASKAVISLGGGTPCFSNNLEIILASQNAQSFYLKASLQTLTERLFKEREHRPLISHLQEKELLNDFIRKHLFERSFYYSQADTIISTDDKNIEEISDEILKNLK